MVIDGKNGDAGSPSVRVSKKSFTDDLHSTFSSPLAWILVLALIITWSCVFVIMFDLMDYKTVSGKERCSPLTCNHARCHLSASQCQVCVHWKQTLKKSCRGICFHFFLTSIWKFVCKCVNSQMRFIHFHTGHSQLLLSQPSQADCG